MEAQVKTDPLNSNWCCTHGTTFLSPTQRHICLPVLCHHCQSVLFHRWKESSLTLSSVWTRKLTSILPFPFKLKTSINLQPEKWLPGFSISGEGCSFILTKEQDTPASAGLWLPGCFPKLVFHDLTHLHNGLGQGDLCKEGKERGLENCC